MTEIDLQLGLMWLAVLATGWFLVHGTIRTMASRQIREPGERRTHQRLASISWGLAAASAVACLALLLV